MQRAISIRAEVFGIAIATGVAMVVTARLWEPADFARAVILSVILFAFVIAGERFGAVDLPLSSVKMFISISSAICFGAAISLGPAAAFPVAIAKILTEIAARRPTIKLLFNTSNYALTTIATGLVYVVLADPNASPIGDRRNLLATAAAIVVFDIVNSGLAAVVIGQVVGTSPWQLWCSTVKGVAFTTLTLPTLGILIPILNRENPLAVILMAVPLIGPYLSLQSHSQIHSETRRTIERLADMLDQRDQSTAQHSQRVTGLVEMIIREMPELTIKEREVILAAAPVHDIGKIGTNDLVLMKPGKLTAEEKEHINRHAADGSDILANLSLYSEAALIVRHHHERWDGRGYPDGIAGEAIPVGARVIAVADTFDAMTSDRVYRKGLCQEAALAEVERCSGTQFDPRVAEIFLRLMHPAPEPAPLAALRPLPGS